MRNKTSKGFTLIELIIVMVILGIMAAVAVPKYMDSITNAEASAEDAVISSIRAGLSQYANNSLYEDGRSTWPINPFNALQEQPTGYTGPGDLANTDDEWTYVIDASNGASGYISHQRADNSRYTWDYDKGKRGGDDAAIGTLGERVQVEIVAE